MDAEIKQPLLALLAWYREMGVTDAVSDDACDWLSLGEDAAWAMPAPTLAPASERDSARKPANREPPALARPATSSRITGTPAPPDLDLPPAATSRPRVFPTTPPATAELNARTAAASARTLDELREILERFDGCALRATAKNLCLFRGAPKARTMIIGEAPGREEDLDGRPFVGRAGQLLDRMLGSIRLAESDVHITNVVYWRPPGNRTPTPQEAQVCRPFLMRQIELVEPEILVLLGGAAAKHILNVAEGILRVRGTWRQAEIGGRTIPAMATLHPAYLLRTPASKRQAWRDLLAIRSRLDQSGGA